MKKVLLATALSLCVTSAFAADPSAVLKVKGTLTNAACTPVLSNGGTVDYGTINLGTLSATAVNQLGQQNIDLTINCTAATKVSWNMVDDRKDSNAKLEATNKLIKDIKRLGFGFRNFINFKKRVFITLNIKKEKTYQVLSRC